MSRKTHWEQVYESKSPLEVSWYQSEPILSLQLIEAAGLPDDAAIIDVGGGASVLVDRLYSKGYRNLSVLDISGRALAHARQRMGSLADSVCWIEADVTEFESRQPLDFWHDRAVFHFLTDAEDRRKYVAALKHALKPGGNVAIAAFAIGGPEKCSGLDIVQYNDEKLSNELGAEFSLLEELSELHATPAGGNQEFSYFSFRRIDHRE